MKLSPVLTCFLVASGTFASVVAAEKAQPASSGLRANANQDVRKTNEVAPDRYWIAPIKNIGLKCIDNSIRAGGGKPNEICITEGEALCIQYDYQPMGGRWQFGIKEKKLRLYDPKQDIVYQYGSDVSHVCIGEEHGFDPNRHSKERPYMTLYNEKTHKVVGSLTCDGTDGKDDENIGQSTMLKLVDQADIGPYATYPLTIVKFKKGQTEDPKDDNSLWNIVVGAYPTDQPTDEPTMEPTFSGTTYEPTDEPTPFTPEPTDFPTAEPTFAPTEELPPLFSVVNFNADKCEWIGFVDTFQELQRRIAMATDPNNPAKIEISNLRPVVFEDIIDISNKYFEISCPESDCVFDLNGYSFVTRDDIDGSPFRAEISGMTVKNGSSRKGRDDDTYNTIYGGAFMLRGTSPDVSSLVLTDSIFRNNRAVSDSGVIDSIDASVTATSCSFENNESGFGGGVAYIDGDSTFERCHFEGNYAEYEGGALFLVGDWKTTITDCTFVDNVADIWDGGAFLIGSATVAHVERCTFTANSAGDWGGAIISYSENTEIFGCSFADNEAVYGGALHFRDAAAATIESSTFAGNSADDGGAVFAVDSAVGFQGCSFDKNEADFGGAIFSEFSSSSLTNCNFSENFAGEGGAILVDGQYRGQIVTLENCNFNENSAIDWGGAVIAFSALVDFHTCQFEGNTAEDGGAVFLDGGPSTGTFDGCQFKGNHAEYGGAIVSAFGASTILHACNFYGNSARWSGGAIFPFESDTSVDATSFECNTANLGGAIYNVIGRIDVSNAEFISNEARGGGAFVVDTANSTAENCLFDQNVATDIGGGAAAYLTSSSGISPTNIMKSIVFQNNTSLDPSQPSDDVLDVDAGFFGGSPQNIQCGADADNCFCDADFNDLPDISTNDLPTTCSGADVGTGPMPCSGCLPTPPSTCAATSRAGAATGADSMSYQEMSNIIDNKMKSMGEKMGTVKEKMGAAMKNMAEKKAEKKHDREGK